jgi:hypothetical protein
VIASRQAKQSRIYRRKLQKNITPFADIFFATDATFYLLFASYI